MYVILATEFQNFRKIAKIPSFFRLDFCPFVLRVFSLAFAQNFGKYGSFVFYQIEFQLPPEESDENSQNLNFRFKTCFALP